MIRIFLAGAGLQLAVLRRSLPDLMSLLTAPLFTIAFIAIMLHAGRSDLTAYAVIGPSVMAIWNMALSVSGDVIDSERHNNIFETTLTTPAPLIVLVLGRIATVTLVSLLSLPESIIVARLLFGIRVQIYHPALFVVVLIATTIAAAGTATTMAAVFVLARSARTFQNSISYPFYLLSGAIVPSTLLPTWLHPVADVVFLSWSTDLFRAALNQASASNVARDLLLIMVLGAAGYAAGIRLMSGILRRVRTDGTVSYA